MTNLADLPPLLVPTPRTIEVRADTSKPSRTHATALPVNELQDPNIEPDGYRLRIDEAGCRIEFAGDDGRRVAHATLAQLRAQYHESIPHLSIEDAPAFPTRGVMLDISRDRVPRLDVLRDDIAAFAALKLNHIQLYTEHTFASPTLEPVWTGHNPITPAELRRIDVWCRAAGLDLAGNQNCFGHLAEILRHPTFTHLAETTGNWLFAGIPRSGPFSLCPTDPQSLEFVRALIESLVPCLTSGLLNIGGDETFDVGQGRSRAAVESLGKAEVYRRHMHGVCAIAAEQHLRPMMWADMIAEHPEAAADLPGDPILISWGYEPDSPFADQLAALQAHGRETWVSPGTSSWRTFAGRPSERDANLAAAARAGLDHGSTGMLITDWGDLGHLQQWPVALLGIATGAQAAWNPDAPADFDAISLHVFGDRTLQAARWLDALGDADADLRANAGVPTPEGKATKLLNASVPFSALFPARDGLAIPTDAETWRTYRDRLDRIESDFPRGLAPLPADELRHTLNQSIFAADMMLHRARGRAHTRAELADRLEALIKSEDRLWLTRSRAAGRSKSRARWNLILDELRD